MATQIGALLHGQRYRIRQQLGKGGFGAVYLADDTRLPGRQVALKENLSVGKDARQQFKREALLLARLHHPNLPQVTDYFSDAGGQQFLVMDYVPGENLRQLMSQRSGPLPVEDVLAIADQVMQALAYMHTWRDPEGGKVRPIIHRDIKPDNIKRTPDGRVMLVDFGIAKVATNTATVLSARALTPGYAPIEQYGGGTDERSDVYALGATLYALLTGKTPPSSVDLATGASLPPLRTNSDEIPPRVVKVIERAMRVNARDRYPSIEKMYLALFGKPLPTTPITTSPPRHRSRVRRGWLLPMGVGVVGFAIAVLVWWLVAHREPQAPNAVADASISMTQVLTPPASPALAVQIARTAEPTTLPPSSVSRQTSPSPLPSTVTIIGAANSATFTTSRGVTPTVTATAAGTAIGTAIVSSLLSSDASTDIDRTEDASARVMATAAVDAATQSSPTATHTPRPTSTPLMTRTPTATPTRNPFTTPRPAVRTNTAGAGGPRSATILEPANNHSANSPTIFRWEPDAALAPGQEFEVVFWRAHEGNEAMARGLVRSSTATQVTAPVQLLVRDTYKWAVYLVQPEPYTRLRRLAGPYLITIASSGDNPESGGSSAPTPTAPSK